VNIISCILGDIALREIENVESTYFEALRFLIERFYIHLEKEDEYGMILSDELSQRDIEKKLRSECYNFINTSIHYMYGTPKDYYKARIYPSVFFTTDDVSILLQVSDLVATSLSNAFWNSLQKEELSFSIEKLPDNNEYLKIYWPLFVKSAEGKVSGYGIKVWW